jgi:plastocyanin
VLRRVLIAGLVAGAIAGCGGDGDEGVATTAPATTDRSTRVATAEVRMREVKFVPHDVTIRRGQSVTWTNDDGVAHTVTATEGAKFDSGNVAPGGVYERRFPKPGRVDYVCTLHPNQTGRVIVR